jgi:hypothetical protein
VHRPTRQHKRGACRADILLAQCIGIHFSIFADPLVSCDKSDL